MAIPKPCVSVFRREDMFKPHPKGLALVYCNLGPEDDTRHYGQRTNKGRDLDKTQHCPPRYVKGLWKRWNVLLDLYGFILFARIFVRFHDEMQCWWATKKALVEWTIVCKDDMNQSKSPTILELFQNCEVKKCGVSQKKLEVLIMLLIDVHIHPVFPSKIGIQGTKPCSHWDWPLSHWWKPRNPNSPTYKRLESKSSSFWPIASISPGWSLTGQQVPNGWCFLAEVSQ